MYTVSCVKCHVYMYTKKRITCMSDTQILVVFLPWADQRFSRYNVAKNRKCTQWFPTELEHLTFKSCCIHWILTPEAQFLVCFALQLHVALSEIQGNQKSEMHQMTPNWTWTLNSQKYLFTPEAQILVPLALRTAVSKISHIYNSPLTTICKESALADYEYDITMISSKVLSIIYSQLRCA